jgi:hypothetical protein
MVPNMMQMNSGITGTPMNPMGMLKSTVITMMMFKTMNNNNDSASQSSSSSNIFEIIYVFIVTELVESLFKYLPALIVIATKYAEQMLKSSPLLEKIQLSEEKKEKISSITIQINIVDQENVIGQALLDLITNSQNTKHVSYKKQNFILNQKDIIEIAEELFIVMKECMVSEESKVESEQLIELFSYTKNMQELRAWLNRLAHEYTVKLKNKLGNHIYYFNQHPINAQKTMDGSKDYSKLPNTCIFTMKVFETNRKFSNLFGPEISAVKQRVEFFVKNSKWYDSKGIPHTLGLLLSGQAGAGKTSSIKCLANETKRHIININLNNDITKVQLDNLFFNETLFVINPSTNKTETYYIPLNQRIYVLEDIDCQDKIVVNRELKEDLLKGHNNSNDRKSLQQPAQQPLPIGIAEKIDLSFLLNLLDGILESPGRIVIMTSNHPEKLDHALIRPGRIDIIANFKKCTRETIFQMMEHFYDVSLQSDVQKIIFDELDDYFISPAEMSKLMFENITDYRAALVELKKYYVNTLLNTEEDVNIVSEKKEQIVLPGYQDTTFDLCERVI